jgi:hypothetical protein
VDLLSQLRQRAQQPDKATDCGAGIRDFQPLPPAAASTIQTVERGLGFALPQLLVDIYCTVANGGIGPGYGLLRVHL